MALSHPSLLLLLDLVEIKLGSLQAQDKEDIKELTQLRLCRHELIQVLQKSEF